MTLND
jgi:hypothetical protein